MKVYCSGEFKPRYAKDGSAGLDLCNNTNNGEINIGYIIEPTDIVIMQTKVHVEIPKDHVGIVAVRSSLGFKGLNLINSIGVIDHGYTGEIGLKFVNLGNETINIEYGERVAQLIVVPCVIGIEFVDSLEEFEKTERGSGGFGSTGRL